jgi:hypothetical protein
VGKHTWSRASCASAMRKLDASVFGIFVFSVQTLDEGARSCTMFTSEAVVKHGEAYRITY